MPRKRLTDLLQEETQKFTPSPDESTIEVTAKPVVETEISESEEKPLETTAKSKTPTKADLEATIQNLQESLEKYQNQEISVQQEIAELKTALSEQKSLSEKLGKELYETKKTALKLAESNSKLIEEMEVLKNQAIKEPVKEPIKETIKEPVKETSKSLAVNPQKYYKTPTIITTKPGQTKDDFTDKTWLLD
jgi:translation initiation factor 2B subunit (eIF-2B alpha/beta/delta family)